MADIDILNSNICIDSDIELVLTSPSVEINSNLSTLDIFPQLNHLDLLANNRTIDITGINTKGDKGDKGDSGIDGKDGVDGIGMTAYEKAVQDGFSGTESEWLELMVYANPYWDSEDFFPNVLNNPTGLRVLYYYDLTKHDVGLGQVDNTADLAKPISNAVQVELNKRLNFVTTIPTSSNANGNRGDIASNGSYLYICLSNNNWRRVPLETF